MQNPFNKFEIKTWTRFAQLVETAQLSQSYLDALKKHLDRLVTNITTLKGVARWRLGQKLNLTGEVLAEIDGEMGRYRELLEQLRADEKKGRQVKRTRQSLEQLVWTWSAIRRDARRLLRSLGWREPNCLRLVGGASHDSVREEGEHWLREFGEATVGMDKQELAGLVNEFFESRAGGKS